MHNCFHQNIWKPDLNIFWIQFLLTNKNNKTDMYLPVLTDCSLCSDRKHSKIWTKVDPERTNWCCCGWWWWKTVNNSQKWQHVHHMLSYLRNIFPKQRWMVYTMHIYVYENWSSLLYTMNDESNLLYFLVIFGIIYLVLGNMQAKQIFLFFWEASYASYFLVFPHHHHQYQCYSFSVIISCNMCTSSIDKFSETTTVLW